ncbi:MAG: ankyrin repeat domain-containing protein [Coxiellaceae bacterium]|nr:ankyrin repeat domain-containing protein [Coxiellaceae bacterium]
MSRLGQHAAELITALLDTKQMWRYFVNGSDQSADFTLALESGYLENQLLSMPLLPELVEKPLNVDTVLRILTYDLTEKALNTTLSIATSKPTSIEDAAYLQEAIDKYQLAISSANSVDDRSVIAEQLIAIATFCQTLPQPVNPLMLYLLCLQNGFQIPMLTDFNMFAEQSTHDITSEIQNGFVRTQNLLDGKPVIAVEDSYFAHEDESFQQYDRTCRTLSSDISDTYSISTITGSKVLLMHAAITNDVDALQMFIIELLREPDFADVMSQALLEAAQYGNAAFVEALLDNTNVDIDINAANEFGLTALHAAAEHNHHEIVRSLLNKGANPYLIYRNKTLFNYALQNGQIDLIDAMLNDHFHHPEIQLGNIARITDQQAKDAIDAGIILPAIESNNYAMVAKCVELDFIHSRAAFEQALNTIATNQRSLEPSQQYRLLDLLPPAIGGLVKNEYFLSKIDIVTTLQLCHACLQSPPKNDTELRQVTLFTRAALEKILREGSSHQLELYFDAMLVHGNNNGTPEEYMMTLAKGAINKHDRSVVYDIYHTNNSDAIFSYVTTILNSPLLTLEQKIQLVEAKKMSGTPMQEPPLIDFLYSGYNSDALTAYITAIMNSQLTSQTIASLLTPKRLKESSTYKHLLKTGNTDKLCAYATAIVTPSKLSQEQMHEHIMPSKQTKNKSSMQLLVDYSDFSRLINFTMLILNNEEFSGDEIYQYINSAKLPGGHTIIELLMQYGTANTVTSYVKDVLSNSKLTTAQKHTLINPPALKKGKMVIEYLFKNSTTGQVTEFINQVCSDNFTNDQMYRLIWPLGSSKSKGLHEQFKVSANKPEMVSAYLEALLKSPLAESTKLKIMTKLKPHLQMPLNGTMQPLDLAALGYIYTPQQASLSCFSKPPEHGYLTAQLKSILTSEHLPTDKTSTEAFVADTIRETYLHPSLEDKNSSFAYVLKQLADSLEISLEPLDADDDVTISTAAVFDRPRDTSAPINIPVRNSTYKAPKPGVGFSYASALSQSLEGTQMFQDSHGNAYSLEQKHTGILAHVEEEDDSMPHTAALV